MKALKCFSPYVNAYSQFKMPFPELHNVNGRTIRILIALMSVNMAVEYITHRDVHHLLDSTVPTPREQSWRPADFMFALFPLPSRLLCSVLLFNVFKCHVLHYVQHATRPKAPGAVFHKISHVAIAVPRFPTALLLSCVGVCMGVRWLWRCSEHPSRLCRCGAVSYFSQPASTNCCSNSARSYTAANGTESCFLRGAHTLYTVLTWNGEIFCCNIEQVCEWTSIYSVRRNTGRWELM